MPGAWRRVRETEAAGARPPGAMPLEYAPDLTLERAFVEATVRCPDGVALRGEEGSLRYGDLLVWAQNVAVALRRAGAGPGDRIGIAGQFSFAAVAGILGVLLAGAVYVPLEAGTAERRAEETGGERRAAEGDRLRLQVASSGVRLLLVDGEPDAGWSWRGAAKMLDLRAMERETLPAFAETQLPQTRPEKPAAVLFGTDRHGVVLSHRGLLRLVSSPRLFSFGGAETVLLHAPLAQHGHALELWGGLLNGATVALAPGRCRNAEELAQAVRRFRVTALSLRTESFHTLVEERPEAFDGLRQVVLGSERPGPAQVEAVQRRAPRVRLVWGAGSAETSGYALAAQIARAEERVPGETPAGPPLLRLLDGAEGVVVDEDGSPVAPGEAGRLAVGGEMLALEYCDEREATERWFREGVGRRANDGRMFITGLRVCAAAERGGFLPAGDGAPERKPPVRSDQGEQIEAASRN